MADHFLTKSQISLDQCLPLGGGLALESYAALRQILSERVSPSAAALFAEPLINRGNDVAAASISWYTDLPGDGRPLAELDEASQSRAGAILSRDLRGMRELLSDPEDGPLVAAALYLAGSPKGDIWVVDGQPVIINWAMLPEGAGRDADSRAAHFAATLGRFIPLSAPPPLNDAERLARLELRPAQPEPRPTEAVPTPDAAAPLAAAAIPVAAAIAPLAAPASQPEERRRLPVIAWLPLLLLLLISGAALVWLLLPNTRIFAHYEAPAVIQNQAAADLARSVNAGLRDRLADLRQSLDGAMCRVDGTLVMPSGMTVDGLLPPNPDNSADAPGMAAPASATPILPPNPSRVQVPAPGGAAGAESGDLSLLDLIEARTVMVIAESDDGFNTGSGFFIAPDLVVTNFHVVSDATAQGLTIINDALGTLHRAELVKVAGPLEQTGADFALLRIPGANQPFFSILTAASSLRLQGVIAAGYPGDVLETDSAFQELRDGNTRSVPGLTVTDGTINTEQELINATHAVVHSAPISQGNSGGPLIDLCGRVVGVNTFVRQGSLRNLNFALGMTDLIGFLEGTGATPTTETLACEPRLLRPTPPQAEAGVAPETEAAADASDAPPSSSGPTSPADS